MLTRREARARVEAELARETPLGEGDTFVVLDEQTIEREWGWVFFWDSKRFLETGNWDHMLLGNLPYVVDRETGAIEQYPIHEPFDWHLARYEALRERRRRGTLGG